MRLAFRSARPTHGTVALSALVLSLLALAVAPVAADAEKAIRPYDAAAHERPVAKDRVSIDGHLKLDLPSDNFILPLFEVDTTDPGGSTTLFSVRNILDVSQNVAVGYFTTDLVEQSTEIVPLAPGETFGRNLRDVAGLATDIDGFKRGVALVVGESGSLIGDFFEVDVDGAFATGDRLIPLEDLCDDAEIRFLDFGSGTDLTILVNNPLGADPDVDPPSFTVTVLDEAGTVETVWNVFVEPAVTQWSASEFASENFGTFVFDFSASGGGWAYASYSNSGLFSVGFGSACVTPADVL